LDQGPYENSKNNLGPEFVYEDDSEPLFVIFFYGVLVLKIEFYYEKNYFDNQYFHSLFIWAGSGMDKLYKL